MKDIEHMSYEDLKKLGNSCMLKEQYEIAINFYEKAIELNKKDESIFYDLSDAYYYINNFSKALFYSNQCLELNQNNERALVQKLLSLIGLGKTNEIKEILNNNEIAKKSKIIQNLVKESLISNETKTENSFKNYDFVGFLMKEKQLGYIEVNNYRNPKIEIKENIKKGIGIFAKEDIKTGEIIILEKALAAIPNNVIDQVKKSKEDDFKKVYEILITKQKLFKKSFNEKIASLFDGNNLNISLNERQNDLNINKQKILQILKSNCITTTRSLLRPRKIAYGLWAYSSYFNHSCLSNCHTEGIGDLLYMVSTSDIKKGEELTISYIPCDIEYSKRKYILKAKWGFDCDCELCKYEKKIENTDTKKLFSKYLFLLDQCFPNDNFQPFKNNPLDLINFLEENKKKMSCYELGIAYYLYGSICLKNYVELSIECLNKALRYNKNRNLRYEIFTLYYLFSAYKYKKDKDMMKKIRSEIKEALLKVYFNNDKYVEALILEAGINMNY